jgi:N-acetylglucosamine PTS system EIIB component
MRTEWAPEPTCRPVDLLVCQLRTVRWAWSPAEPWQPKIVVGPGGLDNIEEVEGCITRLRTGVHDASLVHEAVLKAAGVHGVVKLGTAVQVVIGTDADPVAAEIEGMM